MSFVFGLLPSNWSQFSPFQVTPVIFAEDTRRRMCAKALRQVGEQGTSVPIAIAVSSLACLRPLPEWAGRSVLPIPRNFFRAALSAETGGPCADFETRGAECCTGVTSGAFGDSRWHGRAYGASATDERASATEWNGASWSGCGVTRSLRMARGERLVEKAPHAVLDDLAGIQTARAPNSFGGTSIVCLDDGGFVMAEDCFRR